MQISLMGKRYLMNIWAHQIKDQKIVMSFHHPRHMPMPGTFSSTGSVFWLLLGESELLDEADQEDDGLDRG